MNEQLETAGIEVETGLLAGPTVHNDPPTN